MKLTIAVSLFLLATTVFPQKTLAADDEKEVVLEEVLVTATRRGEADIMTTPAAITVLNGDEALRYAQRDLNDIAVSIPGLSAGSVSAFKSAQFAMRGVSETTIILYKESPVAVTLDEFVIPHNQTSNLEVFDIESVEVLRGPQGTLFGKNTTGGVIAVRTKKPVLGENSFEIQAQSGDFGTRKVNTAVNVGLGEDMAFRFATMQLRSDGYYENNAPYGPIDEDPSPFHTAKHSGSAGRGDGRDLGGDDVFSSRFKVLWSPTDDLNLNFHYEKVDDNGDSPPIVQESGTGYVVPGWNYPSAPSGANPLKHAGSSLRCDRGLGAAAVCITEGHRVDIEGIYLSGDWRFSDSYTLYFNAGRREQESRLPSSYVGQTGPIGLFDATRDDNRETSQFEARIGTDLDGSFNFTAGVYHQKDDTDFCVLQNVGFLDGFFVGTPPDFWNDNPRILCNTQQADAQAIYIDGTWDLGERLHITAGLRYTREEKAWAGRPMRTALKTTSLLSVLEEPLDGADFEDFPEGVVRDDEEWTEPTYRLVFGYDLSDDLFGFIGYSRGFKSGGYNDQVGTQLDPITPLAARPTDPEIADSIEGGIKQTFADGAATLALNTYYVEYTDAQRTFNVSFPDNGGQETLFFNAAEMTVWGVEAEGAWVATDRLRFNYNISYMDASFDKFEADTNYDGEVDVDLGGQPVTRAPEWMGNVEAVFTHDAFFNGSMEWRTRVSYEDDSVSSYSDVDPMFNTELQSRTLVGASVTWFSEEDTWYLRLLGTNLTDERYRTGSLSVATLWVMSAYGPPRYYGLEVGAKVGFF